MMRLSRLAVFFLTLLLLAACGSVKVTPIATSSATINPTDNSISETRDGVKVTARLEDLSLASYQMVNNIASFHVVIDNQTSEKVEIPHKAFVLRNGESQQFRTIAPEEVREIISKDTVYLIPYPYVGYYYLEDQERGSQIDTFDSAQPFYAEYHPQDIFTEALPVGPILPGSRVAGLLYFLVDLEKSNRAEVLLYESSELAGEPRYRLPFAVEK